MGDGAPAGNGNDEAAYVNLNTVPANY